MRLQLPALAVGATLVLFTACASPTVPDAEVTPAAPAFDNGGMFGNGNRAGDEGSESTAVAEVESEGATLNSSSNNGGMFGNGN